VNSGFSDHSPPSNGQARVVRDYLAAVLKLRSYGAALKEIGADDKQETGRWLNNQAESSHLPFRRRELAMQRFRLMGTLQKFTSVHASVHNHFNQQRHLYSRNNFKHNRTVALNEWRQVCAA